MNLLDQEATPGEHSIAADAEGWHLECARRGPLYEQSVGETVLRALIVARMERERWAEELASAWETEASERPGQQVAVTYRSCAAELRERVREGR